MIEEQKYISLIPDEPPASLDDLDEALCIYKDPIIQVWFAPIAPMNKEAKIAIYGITPGWSQMKAIYKSEINRRNGRKRNSSKIAFAGTMRKNLVEMMDQIKIPEALGCVSSNDLFTTKLLHSSSVLKYPVFKKTKNYTGSSPSPLKHPYLKNMLDSVLGPELQALSNCLIIPLGKAANEAIDYSSHFVNPTCSILRGFPHPSGANGHRKKQFEERKQNLLYEVEKWIEKNA